MSELGEGSATAKNDSVDTDGKRPLKIRVMLFFDGTLNNKYNVEEREKNSDTYHANRNDKGNSYDNGRTNVAILEGHTRDRPDFYEDYDLVFKHYIEGQGTFNRSRDSIWGYALAIGESGVPRRAEQGVDQVVNSILRSDRSIDPERSYIQKITIDMIGFSRGAATARYAIHALFNGTITAVDDTNGRIYYDKLTVRERLVAAGIDVEEGAVEVGFAGLFDTVLSHLGSQRLSWTANRLQQKAIARAKKVLHLAAADEHRIDFPLHTVKSAKTRGGEEYYLPGVHADVGGSYNLANEWELERETDESKKVYMVPTNEGLDGELVLHDGNDVQKMIADRDYLIAQGWYGTEELRIRALSWDGRGRPTRCVLTAQRVGISSAYCNIPLKIMAEYARAPGVGLIIDPKLEDRAYVILSPEKELQELERTIRSYIASTKESKPEDWVGENAPLNDAALRRIRNRHFNFSSKWEPGYKPRFEWDKARRQHRRKRYYYDA